MADHDHEHEWSITFIENNPVGISCDCGEIRPVMDRDPKPRISDYLQRGNLTWPSASGSYTTNGPITFTSVGSTTLTGNSLTWEAEKHDIFTLDGQKISFTMS